MHKLEYTHSRNLFLKGDWKPFVKKYFKNVVFEGFDCGLWGPEITISNWDEVKNILPKSYRPVSVKKISSEMKS